jgi:PAS domain S-box-containing protein
MDNDDNALKRELVDARRERARLLDLLRRVPAAITFLRGRDLVVEFAHPIAVAALGGRQLEGRPLLEAIPEFAGEPHVARMLRVFETGETSEETVVVHADKSGTGLLEESHWHSTYQAIPGEDGTVERLLLFDIEVTKEVQQRRRLEVLQEMTAALLSALTIEDVARVVVDEGSAKLGTPRGGLWKLSANGAFLELLYDKGYSPELREAVRRVPVDSDIPLARVLAAREPCFLSSRQEYEERYGAVSQETYAVRTSDELAFFCAPLVVEGEAVGCMSFNHARRHAYNDDEKRFIAALVDQCAIALHRAALVASERAARVAAEREQTRFRAVFEQSQDGILLTDASTLVVDANPAACAILRRSRKDIVGKPGRDLLPPDDRATLDARLDELEKAGRVGLEERRLLLPDGSTRLFEMSATANILPGLTLTTLRDIEDRKRGEENVGFLEEASRMFASSLDPEHTLAVLARLAVPRLSDWAVIDMLDEEGGERRVAVEHVDPEKIALANALRLRRRTDSESTVRRVIRTGEPVLVERITDEMLAQSLSHDPEYLAMVRASAVFSIMVIPLPIRGQNRGAITFAFAESRRQFGPADVRFAQELARRASASFENALAYRELQDSFDTANRLYRLTTALAAAMKTSDVAETLRVHAPRTAGSQNAHVWLLDEASSTLVRTDGSNPRSDEVNRVSLDRPWPVARVGRDRRAQFIESLEALHAFAPDAQGCGDGQAWALLPLTSATGRLLGVLVFGFPRPRSFPLRDQELLAAIADQCAIALDRARAYEAEATALRKKDEFLAMLGHELRNPLAPIVTATSLIRLRGKASERELGILERQSRHLVRLVDDLLDISRFASGKLVLHPEPLEIADVVGQAIESVSKALEDKQLRVGVAAPATGLVVEGDRERLVQVMTNVLVNAAKFTPAGRAVNITVSKKDRVVCIEIRDEGEGIAPEVLPGIFAPFTQGPQPSDRRDGGLGLGLSIARSLVEAHQGTIEAASLGRDRGTTITIRLPLAEAAPAAATSMQPRPASPAIIRRRVLVVDDNADAAEMIATYLESLGYETHTASDGPQALTYALGAPLDAAILDIGLPGMDGYELAAELRTRLGARAPRLIALTGYAQASDRDRSLQSGFCAHFAKPVDLDTLVAALHAVLSTTMPDAPARASS